MSETTAPAVLTEVRGPVLIITMNRPEAKNAANKELAEGVAAALAMVSERRFDPV